MTPASPRPGAIVPDPRMVARGLRWIARLTSLIVLGFLALMAFGEPAAAQAAAPPAILGTWRGTSTCVDKVAFPACHDEVVIYDVRAQPGTDSVIVRADKIVNGARDFMGELTFGRDSTGAWVAEFRGPRAHDRWTLVVTGDGMSGELIDPASGRRVRRVALRRETS